MYNLEDSYAQAKRNLQLNPFKAKEASAGKTVSAVKK